MKLTSYQERLAAVAERVSIADIDEFTALVALQSAKRLAETTIDHHETEAAVKEHMEQVLRDAYLLSTVAKTLYREYAKKSTLAIQSRIEALAPSFVLT